MALIHCWECGKQISDQAETCPNCGAPTTRPVSTSTAQTQTIVKSPKSRSAAILLAIFLGGLGIHKFYLDRPGWGVIYLIFCWTFIPAILGFFEGLIYLFTSEENFQRKYSNRTTA